MEWDIFTTHLVAPATCPANEVGSRRMIFTVTSQGTAYALKLGASVRSSRRSTSEPAVDIPRFPGPREGAVLRVLQQMAVSRMTEEGTKAASLVCTPFGIRKQLGRYGREYKLIEINKAVHVLTSASVEVHNETAGTTIFAGPQLRVERRNNSDSDGNAIAVEFTPLTSPCACAWLLQPPHFERLLRLPPMAARLYIQLARSVRLWGANATVQVALSELLPITSPCQLGDRKRRGVRSIRSALVVLLNAGLVAYYPPIVEEMTGASCPSGGRPAIAEIRWTMCAGTAWAHSEVAV